MTIGNNETVYVSGVLFENTTGGSLTSTTGLTQVAGGGFNNPDAGLLTQAGAAALDRTVLVTNSAGGTGGTYFEDSPW
jgi:hypothetical protein